MTDITLADLFGISKPLIQAPMAGAQDHRLAIAVSKAGGLGSLPCAMLDAETIRSQVAQFREATGNPVNLNFFCHSLPAHDPEREQAWMARLAPYFDEFGIDSPEPGQGGSRQPFSQAFAEVVASLAPEVVSFHFGLPDDALIARVRRSGARIIASATTIEEALWLEEKGVDAIIAQGIEAGGHRGNFLSMDVTQQMGTLALVPQIAHRVDVPVIAAGGIASPE
ncbi:MAG: nitronate monooxygenase, partial [Pseudomonadales bacterium]|nr:nitronate monooxygenase [Pseudomonadales bacterium]